MTVHQPSAVADATSNGTISLAPTAVLFDLDGTITDSGPVITAAIAETLEAFGYPAQHQGELLAMVGPPIRDGFRDHIGVPDHQIDAVVADYRSRYNDRMLQAPLFPGIADIVRGLHTRGVPLAIATSKRQSLAAVIIQDAGLMPYFLSVRGASEDDSRASKSQIIGDALADLRTANVDLQRTVMVGDRRYDVDGGKEHGLATVLVRWGYARPGEADHADVIVESHESLARVLA